MQKTIAVAGLQHETNTFSDTPTTLDNFIQPDNWPALTTGEEILTTFVDSNIPMSGFLNTIAQYNYNLAPIIWANAPPAGKVEQEAYDFLSHKILSTLKALPNIDVLYLDLHGAMVCEHLHDGEGELLTNIRALIGTTTPIVVTLDLHANVSSLMFEQSDCLLSYRSYPHVDMFATGSMAAEKCHYLLSKNTIFQKAYRDIPFLISMNAQNTLLEPNRSIYPMLAELEKKYDVTLSFNCGFPLADTPFTGPTILGYGERQDAVNKAVQALYDNIMDRRDDYQLPLRSIEDAIKIFNQQQPTDKPIIFADTQDNPGCGGDSNTLGIFKALIEHNIKNAAVAILCEPAVIEQLKETAIGSKITLALTDDFQGKFLLENKTDGRFKGIGPFYHNCDIDLGPMALLDYRGIKLILSTYKMQAADRAIFHHVGLTPEDFALLILKSSVHFQADFNEMAEKIIYVEAPGENIADLNRLKYHHCCKQRKDITTRF